MFHHHILTRDDNEMIKKVYMSQKENYLKGDWLRMLMKDLDFIQEQIDEENIRSTPKEIYRKYIKNKVIKGAFEMYMQLKEKSKKKMKYLKYEGLSIQPYLTMNQFSLGEKQLLFSLRSHCYNAKNNFRKMNRGNLKCSLKCNSDESQDHIFQSCTPILEKLDVKEIPPLSNIFGTPEEQKTAIKVFCQIDSVRKQLLTPNLYI